MNIIEFKIKHSTLIEQYQYIELHLKGIYASLSQKDFAFALDDVEICNIHKLSQEIKEIESKNHFNVITEDIYNRIDQARIRRNYWCHTCYTCMVFTTKGDPKKEEYSKNLLRDLREAENLREDLFNIKNKLLYPAPV